MLNTHQDMFGDEKLSLLLSSKMRKEESNNNNNKF